MHISLSHYFYDQHNNYRWILKTFMTHKIAKYFSCGIQFGVRSHKPISSSLPRFLICVWGNKTHSSPPMVRRDAFAYEQRTDKSFLRILLLGEAPIAYKCVTHRSSGITANTACQILSTHSISPANTQDFL